MDTKKYFLFILISILFNQVYAFNDIEDGFGKIAGIVKSSQGEPIAFVTIKLLPINKSTITNEEGVYSFSRVKPGTYTLVASCVGKKVVEKTLNVVQNNTMVVDIDISESDASLNEVVVVGQTSANKKVTSIGKMQVNALDIPQAVAIIGKDVLEQQQVIRLSEAIRNANGVYIYSTRGNTQETFGARGYSFSSNNMFKNGFRVNSGAVPEISSLDKVEILKGSAALLYGNVAAGGIMNLVTKKPKFEQGGKLDFTLGSFNLYKPVLDLYGPISKKWAYRLNGTYEKASSYRDEVKGERKYINPSFLYQPNGNTEVLIEGDYLDYTFTPDFGTAQTNNVIAKMPRNVFLGATWANGRTKQSTATINLNHSFNTNWKISGGLSYQNFNREWQSTDRILPNASGDWNRNLTKSKTLEDYFTAQLNLNGNFNTGFVKHQVLLGSDVDRYNNTNFTFVGTINTGNSNVNSSYVDENYQIKSQLYDMINVFNLDASNRRSDMPTMNPLFSVLTPSNRFGVYVNDLISITEKLKVLAGLRWSYQYILPTNVSKYYDAAVITSVVGKEDKAFSPRLGVVYQPIKNTSLFASYSNSFTVNSGIDVNNSPLSPSLIDQYELGIKNDLFKGNLSVNVTVFRILNSNLAQTAAFLTDGTANVNTNIKEFTGRTKSDGLEIDLSGHPAKGLNIMAGFTYTDAKYTSTPNTVGSNISGQPLLNVPKFTSNASVFYTFNNVVKGLKIGASLFYLGDRTAGNANTVPAQGSAPSISRLVFVNGFTTVDATLGYNFKKFTLLAKISNIGDVLNYNVHENYSINPIPPRQFITTLSYKF